MSHTCRRGWSAPVLILFALAFMLCSAEAASADADFRTGFSVTITEVRTLSLDSNSVFFAPDASAIITGRTELQTWNVLVSSNVDWILNIRGTNPSWDAPWPKPVGDIEFALGDGDFMPLDTSPTSITSGGPADNESFDLNFRVSLDPLKDIPGEYFYGYIVLELESP